jgi:hypothetical protein
MYASLAQEGRILSDTQRASTACPIESVVKRKIKAMEKEAKTA